MHIMAQARPLFLVTTILLTIAAASAQTSLTTPMSEDYGYVEGRTIVYDPQMLDNPFYNLSDYGSAGADPGPVSYFNPKPKPKPKPEAKHEPKPTKSNLKNETKADNPSPAPSSGGEEGMPSLAPEFVDALEDIDAIDILTNSTDVGPPGSDDGSASSAEVPSMAAAVVAAVGYLLF